MYECMNAHRDIYVMVFWIYVTDVYDKLYAVSLDSLLVTSFVVNWLDFILFYGEKLKAIKADYHRLCATDGS